MIRPAQERLFGVIGSPVGHSLSPVMMNRAFEVCGLNCRYLAMEVTDLKEDLPILARVGFDGLSVTVPHKERVMEFIVNVDQEVKVIGAVNTLKRLDEGWEGRNTDWIGVVRSLETAVSSQKVEPFPDGFWAGKRALVVGAGGAARAVCYALKKMGMKVTVSNRTPGKAENLCRDFSCNSVPLNELGNFQAGAWDVIIQTTPVGMTGYDEKSSPVPPALFAPGVVAMDVVYTPRWTVFLREAKERGATVVFGLDMLLYQGVAQFEWWFGIPAPLEAMRKALEDAISGTF
ncbi:MAG: shikimate dehydrogenase [Thermodesulforhabdaceae bacterium]